jgi:hypothetical protein
VYELHTQQTCESSWRRNACKYWYEMISRYDTETWTNTEAAEQLPVYFPVSYICIHTHVCISYIYLNPLQRVFNSCKRAVRETAGHSISK